MKHFPPILGAIAKNLRKQQNSKHPAQYLISRKRHGTSSSGVSCMTAELRGLFHCHTAAEGADGALVVQRQGLLFTTRHRWGVGGRGAPPPPPPAPKGLAKFSSGPLADQEFPSRPSAPISLDPKSSSACSTPLKVSTGGGGGAKRSPIRG